MHKSVSAKRMQQLNQSSLSATGIIAGQLRAASLERLNLSASVTGLCVKGHPREEREYSPRGLTGLIKADSFCRC